MRPGWRPRPAIILSMSLHAAALAALFAWPGAWGWALAAVAANHAVLLLAMLVPGAQSIGRSMNRLPPSQAAGRVALTFDDGPDPDVTPLVLDLLDRHGARATFFCIGQRATAQPALMREIRARGHGIGNHTMHHPLWFALLGVGGQRRELAAAEAALLQTGATNGLVRAPLGMSQSALRLGVPPPRSAACRLGAARFRHTQRGCHAGGGPHHPRPSRRGHHPAA